MPWFKLGVIVLLFLQLGVLALIANNQVIAFKRGSK